MSDQFNGPDGGGAVPPPPTGAPTPGPSPFGPPTQPVWSNTEPTPVYTDPNATQSTALTEGGSAPKRSRGKMIGALVGVAAILGAGTFAVTQIAGDDGSSGGADSPQAVGEQLVKSLDGEDLLGIVDLLLPGERTTFQQPLKDLNKELKRLEVTSGEVDLNKVPGLDITLEDTEVTEQPTNVDDVTNIDISGTATLAVNGEDLPIGSLLIDRIFGGEDPEVDDSETSDDFNATGVATVKEGDRWYLSLMYTLASQATRQGDIPEEGIAPAGAETPDGALDAMLQSIADLDVEQIIAGLNPNEAAALQRYAPLFLDDAQDAMDDTDVDITISDATYDVSGSGDRRQVSIGSITVDIANGDESATVEVKDGCTTITAEGQSFATCSGEGDQDDAIDDALDDAGMDSEEIKTLIDDLRDAFSDFSMKGIVVDKVDGSWFVSPLGTGSELMLSVLRALDRDEIDTLIDDISAAVEPFLDDISSNLPDDFPDDFPTDDTTFDTIPDDTTFDTIPDDTTFDTIPDDTATDDTATDDTVGLDQTTFWSDCIFGTSTDEAKDCIAAGVADGRFDTSTIPGPFLYPECGLFDYYNGDPNGEIYTDSPEQYQETIEPGLQCVLDAAEEDGVDLTYTTPEFVHPECYVGVNPYNYSDEDAADAISEAYDCATAAG